MDEVVINPMILEGCANMHLVVPYVGKISAVRHLSASRTARGEVIPVFAKALMGNVGRKRRLQQQPVHWLKLQIKIRDQIVALSIVPVVFKFSKWADIPGNTRHWLADQISVLIVSRRKGRHPEKLTHRVTTS